MAINRGLAHEVELYAQKEVTYGTDPGAVAGSNTFRHRAGPEVVTRNLARLDRDQDARYNSASVVTTQQGRQSSSFSIPGPLVPACVTATPTAPDMSLLFEALMGSKRVASAHSTTAAGSAGVTLNLTTGGAAAMGIAIGDMIGVDVDGAGTIEVRQVANLVGDVVTMDRKLSSDPPGGRAVIGGVTYRFSVATLVSLTLKKILASSLSKTKVTGAIVSDLDVTIDSSQQTPIAQVTFGGRGQGEATLGDTRPTPTYQGLPLVPSVCYVWFDAGASPVKLRIAGPASLKINNGLELRETESSSLQPTGVKRTGNSGGNYKVEMSMALLGTTGDEDTFARYNNAQTFTAEDILVQLGISKGSIFAWRCPKVIFDPKLTKLAEEIGVTLGGGRAYATAGDDEVTLAFL